MSSEAHPARGLAARHSRRRSPALAVALRDWPLLAVVAAGFAWTAWFVLQCRQYFIQPDELEYLKQSALIAQQLHPVLPGDQYFNSWSQLQQLLLAPVWAIDDRNLAHQVMGVVNALIVASAAIPVSLLVRRVVPGAARWVAALGGLLTVAVPWVASAATMMTEVAAYPAFLWGVLAVHHALVRRSPTADLIGMAGVVLAFAARPQLAVLGLALVLGVVAQEVRFASDGDPLRPRRDRARAALSGAARAHWPLLVAAIAGALAFAVVQPNVFGGYHHSGVTRGFFDAPNMLELGRETLAYVAVGAGVLPLALAGGWVLGTLVRPAGRSQHAFAVVALVCTVSLTVVIGSFTARYTPTGINSRYLFFLAPLFVVGMLALVTERRALTFPLLIGGLAAAWLVYDAQLVQTGPSLVSPDQTFRAVLTGRGQQLGGVVGFPNVTVPHLLGVLCALAVVALALGRRSRHAQTLTVAAVLAVTGFCVAETSYALQRIAETQAGASDAFVEGRTWIDDAMPPGERADVIVSTLGDPGSAYGVWWDVSYWNSTVDRTLSLTTTPDLQQPFPVAMQVRADGSFLSFPGNVDAEGLGDRTLFVRAASDRTFGFRDQEVLAEQGGIQLLRVPSTERAAWALSGTADDTGRVLTGQPDPALLRVFPRDPAAGGSVPVRVELTTLPGSELPARYAVGDRRGVVAPGETVRLDVDVRVDGDGFGDLRIAAPGRADPAVARGVQLTAIEALD